MKIQVLMSSYNGEKYIRDQLDSILTQTCQDFSILIRDDGSCDNTQKILDEYAKRDTRITWYQGRNIGAVSSFFDLIQRVDTNAEYYAFADQDDWWHPEKLERAITVMSGQEKYGKDGQSVRSTEILKCSCGAAHDLEIPILYCGAKVIVDEELKPIPSAVSIVVRKVSFGNALVQNICTGCTCVLNRRFIEILKEYQPRHAIMHDWWFYLIASGMGKVLYDTRPMIDYRQHGDNASGAMISRWQLLKYRIAQLGQKRGEIYQQLEEFEQYFASQLSDVGQKQLEIVKQSKNFLRARIAVISDPDIYRQKNSDNTIFKMALLIGKL